MQLLRANGLLIHTLVDTSKTDPLFRELRRQRWREAIALRRALLEERVRQEAA